VTPEDASFDPPPHTADARAGLGIGESARVLGAYAWVEGRLYQVLGALAGHEASPALAVLLDAHSQQHAWHATLFAERVPLVDGRDPESWVVPPAPAVAGVLDRLAGLPAGAPRAAALARVVLPRLVTGYRRHLARARPVSDAPVIRALTLVVRDEVEALLEAEAQFEQLVDGVGHLAGALEEAGRLETLVAASGPGLVPWPAGRGA
jgi:hypothetical protein